MVKLVENYLIQEPIGSGAFGKVFKAFNIQTNETVAIKAISKDLLLRNPSLQQYLQSEVKSLELVKNSQYVIRHVKSFKSQNNLYIVYEYCNGGNLAELLKLRKTLPQAEAFRIAKQLIEAFKELNKHRVIHRDLKPQNIFFHQQLIKLGDFGFSKTLVGDDPVTTTMVGSPIYMAPQVLRGEAYTLKADIWSMGVILYQMLYGFCPFESSSIAGLILSIHHNHLTFPHTQNIVSASANSLLTKMLQKSQFQRIDWEDLFRHFDEPQRIPLGRAVSCHIKRPETQQTFSNRPVCELLELSKLKTKMSESFKTDSTSKSNGSDSSCDGELGLAGIFELNRLLNSNAKSIVKIVESLSWTSPVDPAVENICNTCLDAANLAVDIFIDEQKEGSLFYYLILEKILRHLRQVRCVDNGIGPIMQQQADLIYKELSKVKAHLIVNGRRVEDILNVPTFLKLKFQQSQRNLSLWFKMTKFMNDHQAAPLTYPLTGASFTNGPNFEYSV